MTSKAGFPPAWRLTLLGALGIGGWLSETSLVRGAVDPRLLQAHGLSAVESPRPAADFSLPRLTGGEVSLSELRGRWVVLTFWASWCGPCRAEMPSLEELHRELSSSGVTVLGVSLDQSREASERFAQQLDLTFPLLWDREGRVGATYRASAIPVSHLVDPQGRIVASAWGARDWSRMRPLFAGLLDGGSASGLATAPDVPAAELPAATEPPTAELALSNPSPKVGQEFFLDVRLRWSGSVEDYLPQPPQVHLPEGIVQRGVTASTDSRSGSRVVLYRVGLRADAPGSYALDPVELRYSSDPMVGETATRLQGPTVEVRSRTWAGLKPRTLALGIGGMLATLIVAVVMGRRWRSRAEEPADADAGPAHQELLDRFQAARGLRLQGDLQGFALALLALERQLGRPGAGGADSHQRLEESLRYGGQVPPPEELDRLQRAVERRLEALRPDPDAAVRRSLRLRAKRS